MREGGTAWVLRRFCPLVLVCILCLGTGLFLGRMLLRRSMGALALQTKGTVIAEYTPGPATEDRLNVNTASVEELAELPGVGRTLAERIVAYRRENGRFRYPYELMDIPGVDEKTYLDLRDRITVG